MKRIFLLMVTSFVFLQANGQTLDERANDFLRQSDKLYVVMSVLITIFAALIVFLIFQERKISKLEKQLKEKNS